MKGLFLTAFIGLMFSANFAVAQKPQDETAPTWKNKLYSQMGYDEKLRFVAAKSDQVLTLFGRTEGDKINEEGRRMIKNHLDAYVRRAAKPKFDGCGSGDWLKSDLSSVLKRGAQYAAAINEEFAAQKLPPELGIYVAMIETEFCPCLQSPTGSLGMFQWSTRTGELFGLKTRAGATPGNPDERCQPRPASRAASKYFRSLIDLFGNDAVGVPVAVGAFNRGEGSTKMHIAAAAAVSDAARISFWVLIETQDKVIEKLFKESRETAAEEADSFDEETETVLETSRAPGFMK